MPDPISFTSTSPIHELPLLFVGQAQKELTVNEALLRVDMLLAPAIEGVADVPPTSPFDGECWLVGESPTGAWDGHGQELACFALGTWLFVEPRDGMRMLDRSTGQLHLRRFDAWTTVSTPAAPSGGATVDAEARAAIAGLIAALCDSGILPAT